MKTNFHMLREFKYSPKNWGFCTSDEIDMIESHFKIKERSDVELQNLRDFVVMYYAHKKEGARDEDFMALSDEMSAITGVIDMNKSSRGMEV